MKRLKLFLLSILFAIGIHAEEQSHLVMHLHNGSSASFRLTEHPKITFSGEVMSVVSTTSSMEFNIRDVKDYIFSSVATSINELDEEAKATVRDNTLSISGVCDGTILRIYNVSGVEVLNATAAAGNCSVSLQSLPRGLYIVTYNNTTFKFLKK